MNCSTMHTWMVEYADGALDAVRQSRAQAHLNGCVDCAAQVRGMAETRQMLLGLAPARTSAQFDARLSARLASIQHTAASGGWWSRLFPERTSRLLRPTLALGAASLAVVGILLSHAPIPAVPPPAAPADDSALITQCVALHQRDVAAQPLTDPVPSGVGHGEWTGGAPVNANPESLTNL